MVRVNTPDPDKVQGNVMKVQLSIGDIPSTLKDYEVTSSVLDDKGSKRDGGEWKTKLWSRSNRYHRALRRAINNARNYTRDVTLASDVKGERLLKTTFYLEYKTKMQELEACYWEAAKKMLKNYDRMVEAEKKRLGKLSDTIEYPSRIMVKNTLHFQLDFLGIPKGNEMLEKYGLTLPDKEVKRLSEQVEAKTTKQLQASMVETYKRVFKAVHSVASKLADSDATFRDSLVGNMHELANIIPNLNMTDDPYLETLAKDIKDKLGKHSAKELREDPDVRLKVASEALNITKQMSDFFGGPNDKEDS